MSGEIADFAAQMKKLEKEKEKLMVLSMTKEKAMRAREDELVDKTQKLESVIKKMKKELIDARTIKQYFILQDMVINTIRAENPEALASAYTRLGVTPEKVVQLNEATKKIKEEMK